MRLPDPEGVYCDALARYLREVVSGGVQMRSPRLGAMVLLLLVGIVACASARATETLRILA
jgi:hypothetical protein